MEYSKEYLERLKLNAIIYDDEILDDVDFPATKEYIFSKEFLEKLEFRVSINLLVEEFDHNIKRNIYDVLHHIRTNGVNKEYIPLINKIIVTLNSTNERGASSFYKIQYLKRQGCFNLKNLEKKDLELYTPEANKDLLKTIRDYATLDHDILDTILYSSDEEFSDKIKDFVGEEFFGTLNVLRYEYPSLFDDKIFKKRIKYVLKHVSKLSGERNIGMNIKACKMLVRIKKVI